MAKRHRGSRSGGYRKSQFTPKPAAVQEPKSEEPVRSAAMQTLMAEADRIDKLDEERKKHGDGFVPKPRAVRRFEKYANMGD